MSDRLIPCGLEMDQVVVTLLSPGESGPLALDSIHPDQLLSSIQGRTIVPMLELSTSNASEESDQEDTDRQSLDYSTGSESQDDCSSISESESSDIEPSIIEIPPVHLLQQISTTSFLTSIPTELHYLIFSQLDSIDSTCLGLTSKHFRAVQVQRSLHEKVPLSTRRKGPNPLERAWNGPAKHECRHCGVHRCQLYRHLKDWVPVDYEYCAIRQVYGLKAKEESAKYCYRSNPSKPGRCGRHLTSEDGEALVSF